LRDGATGTPQDRLDADDELARGERLAQVIVGAEFETHDTIELIAACGHHNDRHAAVFTSKRSRYVVAVNPGQSDVQHQKIRGTARQAKRRVAVSNADDREPFTFEMVRQQFANRTIVVG
jgi:hypothetical protein